MYRLQKHSQNRKFWNKGKLMDQKLPLMLQEIWSIRMRLQSEKRDLEITFSALRWNVSK